MRKPLALLLLSLSLAGCASGPASMLIDEDTAIVSATGRNASERMKVVQASLAEAARVTRAQGYRYFVILDAADASRMGRRIVPIGRLRNGGTIHEQVYGTTNLPSASGLSGNLPPAGRWVGYSMPGLDITIRMYRDGQVNPNQQGVWNSDVILGPQAAER